MPGATLLAETPHASSPSPARTWSLLPSPVGDLLLTGTDDALSGVYLADHYAGPAAGAGWERNDARLRQTRAQLTAYFDGRLRAFELPLEAAGTPFQQRVWEALRAIPYGEVCTYGELAASIGAPGAARAVGSANSRNPISIIVPCHRVVRGGGLIGGYAGGVGTKSWLLALERGPVADG